MEIVHVFTLMVFVGVGEDQALKSKDMHFYDIDRCTYFAKSLHRQGQKITAYCLPKKIAKDSIGQSTIVY